MMVEYYCPKCKNNLILRFGPDETGRTFWFCEYCGEELRSEDLTVIA
jgi:ribosomal protein L37AE/L43A